MNYEQVSLNPKLLLAAMNQSLDKQFYQQPRDASKQLFKKLNDGEITSFMRIDTGEAGEVMCDLSLDKTLYVGKLSFGKFRRALAMMMHAIKARLEVDEKLNALRSKDGEIMFNVPGIIKEGEQFNVMVCSFKSLGPGLASVRLMYLDPDKYAASVQQANAS